MRSYFVVVGSPSSIFPRLVQFQKPLAAVTLIARAPTLYHPLLRPGCLRSAFPAPAQPLATGNAGTRGEADSLATDPLSPLAVAQTRRLIGRGTRACPGDKSDDGRPGRLLTPRHYWDARFADNPLVISEPRISFMRVIHQRSITKFA